MDNSVGEEREPKRKRLGIISREDWEVGQQVWIVVMITILMVEMVMVSILMVVKVTLTIPNFGPKVEMLMVILRSLLMVALGIGGANDLRRC